MPKAKRANRDLPGSDILSLKSPIPRRACHRCRAIHKKCNIRLKENTCSNCERAGVLCEGGGNSELQIRFSEFSHRPPIEKETSPSPSPSSGSQYKPTDEICPAGPRTGEPHLGQERTSADAGATASEPGDGDIPGLTPLVDSYQNLHTLQSWVQLPRIASGEVNLLQPDPLQADPCPSQLTNDQCKIIKHFFTVLVPWFDYCCAQAYFRSYFRVAIAKDPGILYAILAVSARHIEAVSSTYKKSDEYERKCLGVLIPMLNKNNATQSQGDSVLVSALLLRLLDEMTDPVGSDSTIRHAVSAPLFLRIRQPESHPSELSNAAMAIVLRQEIHVANMAKRPVEVGGLECGIEDSLGPASDVMWTCRIMSHAARVTNYAYSRDPRSEALWDELWGYLERWTLKKPTSFHALTRWDDMGLLQTPNVRHGIFPEIYYIHDCSIAGHQYLEICKIVLMAHDPRMPALGLGHTRYKRAQETRIKEAVRTVCGIWLSNPDYVPARVLAGLGIALAGELFTDPSETECLLDIISEAEMHVGWPCLKVSPQLREFWSLNDANIHPLP